jgi:hypothetical protein
MQAKQEFSAYSEDEFDDNNSDLEQGAPSFMSEEEEEAPPQLRRRFVRSYLHLFSTSDNDVFLETSTVDANHEQTGCFLLSQVWGTAVYRIARSRTRRYPRLNQ